MPWNRVLAAGGVAGLAALAARYAAGLARADRSWPVQVEARLCDQGAALGAQRRGDVTQAHPGPRAMQTGGPGMARGSSSPVRSRLFKISRNLLLVFWNQRSVG